MHSGPYLIHLGDQIRQRIRVVGGRDEGWVGLTHQPEFSGGKGMIPANISCLYIYNLYPLVCVCALEI